jgi:hypothetical protein
MEYHALNAPYDMQSTLLSPKYVIVIPSRDLHLYVLYCIVNVFLFRDFTTQITQNNIVPQVHLMHDTPFFFGLQGWYLFIYLPFYLVMTSLECNTSKQIGLRI